MKVEDLIVYGKEYIHSDYVKMLLGDILNLNPLELLNHLDDYVEEDKVKLFKEEMNSLKEGKPIQYVLGHVNFFGNKFYVNKNVLIPRFETEELVEKTIEYINKYFNEPIDIIDLGCGSGVIGLTLENKVSTNSVDLIDISKEALEVTKQNIENLNSKANTIESNFFGNIDKKYDVIISNPPYIKTNEEIEDIVKENEPHLALYAGDDGLDCYKEILKNIKPHMKDKCIIAFEIGADQKEDIINLINEYLDNIKIETKKDLSQRDRMIFIFKNIE
ncbi:MAG: peptide chain release factor N(5)-glutamine methyltransferase [Bacilli bacterium]|nr:peptide chain release factor N(5)-glutamine methyltransferase [Bacilli bacterium]